MKKVQSKNSSNAKNSNGKAKASKSSGAKDCD